MVRLCICALLLLCLPEPGKAQASSGDPRIAGIVGAVSQDSLRATIAALQNYGSRHWSMENRREIALWVGRKMRDAGLTDVVLDSFKYYSTWQYNVVGTLPGSTSPDSLIILGAHTDSYSWNPEQAPGADDNASGMAAVLEAARMLRLGGYLPNATFLFLGFAAEEAGLRGSVSYAGRLRAGGGRVSAMINFDMIACKNAASSPRDFSAAWYDGAEWLARLDSAMARTYTGLVPVLTTDSRTRTDSYPFWEMGYPAVFLHERGNNPTYHTPNDILDSLDLAYAQDITRTGLATALTVDESIRSGRFPFGVPEAFALFQNYPNPFNPGTRIRYDVPESRMVTITVYDLLGRLVTTLVHEWKNPGSYSVPFDGTGLASGVYLYRLEASPNSLVRKMILVK